MNPTPRTPRLLVAALLAALTAFPARADDSDTAGQTQTALQTNSLDRLYTGGRRFAQQQGAPVQPAPPGARPVAPTVPTAPIAGPIPQADIDRCLNNAALDADTKRFYADMTTRLQTSETGLQILRNMLADCQAHGNPVAVDAPVPDKTNPFGGSAVVNSGGLEGIVGVAGFSNERRDGTQRQFQFNRKFLEFHDRDIAVQMAAANMGHELTHLQLHAEVRALMPQYSDVFEYALLDEQNARVRGFLVDYELADGKATGDTRNAAWLAENPGRYFDDMKLWDAGYAIALQQSELRDPIPAYQDRITTLQQYAARLQKDLDGYPLHLQQIDHVKTGHADVVAALKQGDPLTLLRQQIVKLQESHPKEIQETQKAVTNINAMLARLQGPQGPQLLAKLKAMSYDPAFADFVARNTGDIERLQRLVHDKPLQNPPAGQQPMAVATFVGIFEALHGAGTIQKAAPWTELNPPIEQLKTKYELKP